MNNKLQEEYKKRKQIDALKNTETKEQMVYLDTNSFYEFLAINGFSFADINTGDDKNIDYALLENEFNRLMSINKIGLSSTILFEIIAHHRKMMGELRKILTFLHNLYLKNHILLIINHNGPAFAHLNNTESDINRLINPRISNSEVKIIINEKIDSEANILATIVYFLSLGYALSRYGRKTEFVPIMDAFAGGMQYNNNANITLVKDALKISIKTVLQKAYDIGDEKKSFRKIFSDILAQGIAMLLIQMDHIRNTLNSIEETFFYQDTFGDDTETIENICNRWNKNDVDFKNNLKIFIDSAKENIKKVNYSETQAEYLGSVIYDLFNMKTKMDKNDASDFWLLSLSSPNSHLMTFDNQMLSALLVGNKGNYDYINQLKKHK